jgi:hypothetical protein
MAVTDRATHIAWRTVAARRWRFVAMTIAVLLTGSACVPSRSGTAKPTRPSTQSPYPAGGNSAATQVPPAVTQSGAEVETRTGEALFWLPSRNIACAMSMDSARCDIVERGWTPPARPVDCPADHGDFGRGLVVDRIRVSWTCAGDTVVGAAREVLAYGRGIRVGGFVCLSARSGVQCSYEASGHGFVLAQEAYRIF